MAMSLTSSRFQAVVGAVSVIGVVVSMSIGLPTWLTILFVGGLLYTLAVVFITNPLARIAAATTVAVITGIVVTAIAVHDHPSLARVKSEQPAPKTSRTEQSRQSKSKLAVSNLKDGGAIRRCTRIKGTGTISAGQEVWVGHRNDKDGSANGDVMNLRQATNVRPGQWETKDDYWIGDEKDNRSFWVYVYELPSEAGSIIREWKYPQGFEKEDQDWQPSLLSPIDDADLIGVFRVTRTDAPGCG
jgi:hypothetical protein